MKKSALFLGVILSLSLNAYAGNTPPPAMPYLKGAPMTYTTGTQPIEDSPQPAKFETPAHVGYSNEAAPSLRTTALPLTRSTSVTKESVEEAVNLIYQSEAAPTTSATSTAQPAAAPVAPVAPSAPEAAPGAPSAK